MKNYKFIFLLFLVLSSCNLKEKLAEMQNITNDLESHFNHDNINLVLSWGTDEDENNAQITFYEYNVSEKEYNEMKKTASEVSKRLTTKYEKFKNLDFVEVRFSEEMKKDKNSSFVTFKERN
jgi:hypothetical protein